MDEFAALDATGQAAMVRQPILFKDLIAYEGTTLAFGSVFFRNHIAPYTHEVVRGHFVEEAAPEIDAEPMAEAFCSSSARAWGPR